MESATKADILLSNLEHPNSLTRIRLAHSTASDSFHTIETELENMASVLETMGLQADSNSVKGMLTLLDSVRRLVECNFNTLIRGASNVEGRSKT